MRPDKVYLYKIILVIRDILDSDVNLTFFSYDPDLLLLQLAIFLDLWHAGSPHMPYFLNYYSS
jgi:hypothetical protein